MSLQPLSFEEWIELGRPLLSKKPFSSSFIARWRHLKPLEIDIHGNGVGRITIPKDHMDTLDKRIDNLLAIPTRTLEEYVATGLKYDWTHGYPAICYFPILCKTCGRLAIPESIKRDSAYCKEHYVDEDSLRF